MIAHMIEFGFTVPQIPVATETNIKQGAVLDDTGAVEAKWIIRGIIGKSGNDTTVVDFRILLVSDNKIIHSAVHEKPVNAEGELFMDLAEHAADAIYAWQNPLAPKDGVDDDESGESAQGDGSRPAVTVPNV